MDINFICPINNLSYGIVSANIVHALTLRGNKVALLPLNPHNMEAEQYLHESIRQSIANSEKPNWDAPCIRLYHQFHMNYFVGTGLRIGFPIFELDTFSEIEKHHCSISHNLDRLFVCSNWAKKIAIKELQTGDGYIKVIPLGVNSEIFSPARQNPRKTTIFLNVGKWEVRKGHMDLCHAFADAFSENDDVELWMMCTNIFMNEQETKNYEDIYKYSKLGSKIKFIPRVNTQDEVAHIMQMVDCGVFPAKAEGWNLELLEMMSCGKMVIVSNVTGHTEFCTRENSFLVDSIGTEKAFAKPWFNGQGSWHKLNNNQLVEHMKTVHNMKQSGHNMINEAGIETAKKFSWNYSAACIEEGLK